MKHSTSLFEVEDIFINLIYHIDEGNKVVAIASQTYLTDLWNMLVETMIGSILLRRHVRMI